MIVHTHLSGYQGLPGSRNVLYRGMAKKRSQTHGESPLPTFEDFVLSIRPVHDDLAAQPGRAVNLSLTLRNWFIAATLPSTNCAAPTGLNTARSSWQSCLPGLWAMASAGPGERELRRDRSSIKSIPRFGRRRLPIY